MRKKISLNNVKVGMFIDELCGSWMDSPFWTKSFRLKSNKDLVSLQKSGIREVWIDTRKGTDVDADKEIVVHQDSEERTDKALARVAREADSQEKGVSFEAELDNARKIQMMAAEKVTSMFQEVRMGKALQAQDAVPLANEIYLSVVRNPGALISLTRLKTKDDYTYMHSVAVCALMIALGRQLGLARDVVKSLGMAGLLHDIGKMAVADDILNKPGQLTDEEFSQIKTHPERGWQMLKESSDVDEIALDVCLHHHERVDGKGYPEQLGKDDLSLYAKMGAVCDVYDAITSDRSYKAGWSPAESIRKMASWKDGHFDDRVFDSFVKTIGIYPVGSLLKLRSGKLGVVIDQSTNSLLRPKVKVFYSTSAKAHIAPKVIDLGKTDEEIENIEDPSQYGFNLQRIMEQL
ncbi:MAG: putative nucleotidyltransferase with HDIG domain [Gammaproteobacteria bacterium]|jgi:putative nucleotidyltransferase with HDIG domain